MKIATISIPRTTNYSVATIAI